MTPRNKTSVAYLIVVATILFSSCTDRQAKVPVAFFFVIDIFRRRAAKRLVKVNAAKERMESGRNAKRIAIKIFRGGGKVVKKVVGYDFISGKSCIFVAKIVLFSK